MRKYIRLFITLLAERKSVKGDRHIAELEHFQNKCIRVGTPARLLLQFIYLFIYLVKTFFFK
jgi:hypothetical protein